MKGVVTIELPCGLVIKACTYHMRDNGERWASWPTKRYITQSGRTAYKQVRF